MEFLRQLLAKINVSMADLTPSQRLAIALCAVVVVGSFLALVRWSSEPEWVRLLEEPMTTEQIAAAREVLPAGQYRIVGSRILVSPGDRNDLFWTLQGAGALPADTSTTFARLIEDDSPFRPASENDFRRNVALQNELAKVIAASPVIHSAEVFIATLSKRKIGSRSTVPTASVTVTMRPGKSLDEKMVEATAAIVAGAVPGLVSHQVTVIDGTTMQPHKVLNPEDEFARGLLRETKQNERYLRQKVIDQLSYLPGVRVSVSVELDPARQDITAIDYAKPAVLEETTLNTDRQAGTGGGASGVGPNVGQSLASTVGNNSDTKEETSTKFQPPQIAQQKTTTRPPFTRIRSTASVSIPRSYLTHVIQLVKGDDTEPTHQEIDAQFVTERARVLAIVKNIIMTRDDADVTVDYHHDIGMEILPDGTAVSVASIGQGGSEALNMIRDYGREVGLGFLALVGLVMMGRIARKSSKLADASMRGAGDSGDEDDLSDKALLVGPAAVGSAVPTEGGLLIGKEIDDTVLRERQLREQVGQLVGERPEVAARLVRRWVEGKE